MLLGPLSASLVGILVSCLNFLCWPEIGYHWLACLSRWGRHCSATGWHWLTSDSFGRVPDH